MDKEQIEAQLKAIEEKIGEWKAGVNPETIIFEILNLAEAGCYQ